MGSQYKIQVVILRDEDTEKFICESSLSLTGFHPVLFMSLGNYLSTQESHCKVLSDPSGVEKLFRDASSKYHDSVADLEAEVSQSRERPVTLVELCEIHLPQETNSYLPGDTIIEFYKDASIKEE